MKDKNIQNRSVEDVARETSKDVRQNVRLMETVLASEMEFQGLLADAAKRCRALSEEGAWCQDATEKIVAFFESDAGAENLAEWQHRVVSSPANCDSADEALSKIGKYKGIGAGELKTLAYFFAKQSYQVRPEVFAEDFAWLCIACLKAAGAVPSLASSAFRRMVAQELSVIKLPPQCGSAAKIAKIANHYSVVILGDDANLAKVYEKARKAYLESPEKDERVLEFGWTLFDCLKRSIQLKNVKLTRFFAKDLSSLKLPVSKNETDGVAENAAASLEKSRVKILRTADEVISGLGQVKSFVQDRQWQSALTACDRFLEDNPRSQEGYLLRAKIQGVLQDFEGALRGYLRYFQAFSPDEAALTDYAWFLVRTFASVRPRDPEWRKLKIGVAGVSKFLGVILDHFDLIADLKKPDKVYSALLNSVTRACSSLMSGRRSRLASQYVVFVEKWGLRNLSDADDREWVDAAHRSHPSLRVRVADALMLAASHLPKNDSVGAHPVIREFVTKSIGQRGITLPARTKWRLPEFYLTLGDLQSARHAAVELVASFPAASRAWNVLGATYPGGSVEQLTCRCRARTAESEQERVLREWLDAPVGVSVKKMVSQLGEDTLAADIRARGVSEKNISSFIVEQAKQADRLILENGHEVAGLVLTSFRDKHDGKMRYRLWWPSGREIAGGQAFVMLDSFENFSPSIGDPVTIQLVGIDGKLKPVLVRARTAEDWDGYPRTAGVVVSQDKSRGFVRIVTQFGDDLWADLHVCPNLSKLKPGDGCQIGVLKRQNDMRVLFGGGCAASVSACSEYVKDYSGRLGHPNGAPGGIVDDVTLSRELIRGISLGTSIKGMAVKVSDRRTKQSSWLAVSVEKPSKVKQLKGFQEVWL